MFMSQPDSDRQSRLLRTALLLLAAWLIALLGLFGLYAEFRKSASLFFLGTRYTGREALLILLIYAAIPVTLLAVALKKFFDYKQLTH